MGAPENQTWPQKCSAGCVGFGNFLYCKNDKGETLVMGRTGESWAKIGLFYLVFYGFLAAFFIAMLAVFMSTVNQPEDGGPKLTQFIKNQPGLTRVDRNKADRLPTPFTYSNATNSSAAANDKYTQFITDYLKVYDDNTIYPLAKCNVTHNNGYEGNKACKFDYMTELGECNNIKDNAFGLADKKPCLFVKINKVYDWVPDVDGDYLELSCDKGTVYPKGFLLAAFPFRGQKGFQLPIVAVQLDLTTDSKQTVICELKGKGIEVSSSVVESRAFGKIRFEDIEVINE